MHNNWLQSDIGARVHKETINTLQYIRTTNCYYYYCDYYYYTIVAALLLLTLLLVYCWSTICWKHFTSTTTITGRPRPILVGRGKDCCYVVILLT
jgi:hypothetical protein